MVVGVFPVAISVTTIAAQIKRPHPESPSIDSVNTRTAPGKGFVVAVWSRAALCDQVSVDFFAMWLLFSVVSLIYYMVLSLPDQTPYEFSFPLLLIQLLPIDKYIP